MAGSLKGGRDEPTVSYSPPIKASFKGWFNWGGEKEGGLRNRLRCFRKEGGVSRPRRSPAGATWRKVTPSSVSKKGVVWARITFAESGVQVCSN